MIEAGDGYGIASPGDLTLRAQGAVVLSDGFSVGSGASFTAISKPPPQEIVRTYAYQDVQYFLTQGDGPWGARSWSYDRIGNRLTETRYGLPADVYQYPQNPADGNSPMLSSIALGTGNTRDFTYGAAGHLESISVGSAGTGMSYDEAGRLATLTNLFDSGVVDLSYDGRGYLSGASSTAGAVSPVYSSDGLFHARVRSGETVAVLYLAGRPVGRVTVDGAGTEIQTYTTDHLGTPMLVADGAGAKVWSGGLEPFGGDGAGSATVAGVELRFPGQVEDESWEEILASSEIYYNVHRWYLPSTGRYTRTDPVNLGILGSAVRPSQLPIDAMDAYYLAMTRTGTPILESPYLYAGRNPLVFYDPLGLFGPGALAGAGGGCMAVDGPLPFGDLVGVPLLAAAAAWWAGDKIVDWWDNRDRGCSDCDRGSCEAMYQADSEICRRQSSPRLRMELTRFRGQFILREPGQVRFGSYYRAVHSRQIDHRHRRPPSDRCKTFTPLSPAAKPDPSKARPEPVRAPFPRA